MCELKLKLSNFVHGPDCKVFGKVYWYAFKWDFFIAQCKKRFYSCDKAANCFLLIFGLTARWWMLHSVDFLRRNTKQSVSHWATMLAIWISYRSGIRFPRPLPSFSKRCQLSWPVVFLCIQCPFEICMDYIKFRQSLLVELQKKPELFTPVKLITLSNRVSFAIKVV